MNAYDYTAQKWVTGAEAKTLRRGQLVDELDLLKSSKGEAYLLFTGSHLSRGEAITACCVAIAEINRSLS
jgi:hypothetical protein